MVVRKSVLLDDDEQASLAELTSPSDEMRAVLTGWASTHHVTLGRQSESSILRALIKVGLASLREARLEAGYQALARESHPDERTESRSARARHAAATAVE
jgi:hypothetical protein